MTQTRKQNYALRENGIKQVRAGIDRWLKGSLTRALSFHVKVLALLANPYLTEGEELKHAAERRAEYVPKFVIEKQARWMRREKSLPGLVR